MSILALIYKVKIAIKKKVTVKIFLNLIRLGDVLTGHQFHNSSALSTWIEIMSSPLVTFNFKTFPKHRSTQFSIVMAQIWEMLWRPMVSINYDKKSKRFDFFNFFSNKSYLFCLKLSSTLKMLSLEVFHVDIAQ